MAITQITIAGETVSLVTMPATPGLRAVEFDMFDGAGMTQSPFTGKTQVQQWYGGDMWSGKATLPPEAQADADNWIAFLEELRGMLNAFQMGDPLKTSPSGSLSGKPFIDNTQNGGNPAGSIFLGTKGWTPNAQGVLWPGDYIQVGFRLYRVLDFVDADADGNAVFSIWPSLREQPTNDGTTAGFLNATGEVAYTISRPLGNNFAAVIWEAFLFGSVNTMPADAVIQGIYPVLIASANYDIAEQYLLFGSGLTLFLASNPNAVPFLYPFGTGTGAPQASFSSTVCYSDSIGTELSALSGMQIEILLNTALEEDPVTDTITATAVGFAIYYTSAIPETDPQMTAPFAVPTGQGLAWALPIGVQQSGAFAGGSGILDPSTGFGIGTPTINNGGLVFENAKGLFRLATNKRDWKADIQHVTDLSFPFQEYR